MSDWQKKHPMGTTLGDSLPGAPVLAPRGNPVTGVRTIPLTDPDQAAVLAGKQGGRFPRYDRPLTVEVWYPALPGADDTRAVYTDYMGRADQNNLAPFSIEGRAFRDAAPDASAGPCPVVVISHGYPGSRILLVNLAENLSSKGYVVLSIGHTDNTYPDFPAQGSIESAVIHRSLDQRFVISQLKTLNSEASAGHAAARRCGPDRLFHGRLRRAAHRGGGSAKCAEGRFRSRGGGSAGSAGLARRQNREGRRAVRPGHLLVRSRPLGGYRRAHPLVLRHRR